MENIREITLNAPETAPHKASVLEALNIKVTTEDIDNLKKSLIPNRRGWFEKTDLNKQIECAALFKTPEEDLRQLIFFLISGGGGRMFSVDTISDTLDFLDQSIAGGNGKYQNLKKVVKNWMECSICEPISKQKEEYYEEDGPVNPEELILDFMIAEGEVTEKDIAAFKEKLLFDGKRIFGGYSPETQIRYVAIDKMPVEKLRQVVRLAMSAKSNRIPKLHNILGDLGFFMSEIKPEAGKKYKELNIFIGKLREEASDRVKNGQSAAVNRRVA